MSPHIHEDASKNQHNFKVLVPKAGTKSGPKAGGQKEGYLQSKTWFVVSHVNMLENSHNNTASSGELKSNSNEPHNSFN